VSFWTAIVVIVAISTISGVLIERYKAMGRNGNALSGDERRALESERNDARRELTELRERVKVLERIATDSNSTQATESRQIAAEIEALRERQG
jgi:hypothetical protein